VASEKYEIDKKSLYLRVMVAKKTKNVSGSGPALSLRQNRRQKVFNRGLFVCEGDLNIPKIDKNFTD